jgi:serine/threonine protein kinase
MTGQKNWTDFPVIPGYRIKKKLGQGGMANVYLGVQENLSRMVAIKVLSTGLFQNRRLSKRFLSEARMLSRLNHPNIVTIHEVGQADDCYFIVMEYLQDNLKEKIKKRGMDPLEALHVVKQIADALFYAHELGIIHRDIKPDNIMFRKDGTAVILDFGIAKAIDSETKLTKTGMSIGTPLYMSPEQCNAKKLDGRSDIYSLGVVLHEMLTGKPPYDAKDTIGIVMKHLRDPIPKLPADLSPYQPIIDRMMAKELKKRVRSRDGLNAIIKDLLKLTQNAKPGANKTRGKNPVSMTRETVAVQIPYASTGTGKTKGRKKTAKVPRTVEPKKENTKGKFFLWFIIVLLVAAGVVLLTMKGQPLSDLLGIIKNFFKAVGKLLS